nr:PREDICTED: Ca(2+)-independent N-acyltransferase [Equus przewalskii]
MGLSRAPGGECRPSLSKFPRSRPKPASRTAEESGDSQALVQLSPKQPEQGTLEQGRSIQQGEKVVVNLEITPNQKRAEWNSTPKPTRAGKLTKQAAKAEEDVLLLSTLSFSLLALLPVPWTTPGPPYPSTIITSLLICAIIYELTSQPLALTVLDILPPFRF